MSSPNDETGRIGFASFYMTEVPKTSRYDFASDNVLSHIDYMCGVFRQAKSDSDDFKLGTIISVKVLDAASSIRYIGHLSVTGGFLSDKVFCNMMGNIISDLTHSYVKSDIFLESTVLLSMDVELGGSDSKFAIYGKSASGDVEGCVLDFNCMEEDDFNLARYLHKLDSGHEQLDAFHNSVCRYIMSTGEGRSIN